jgi:hypothetical protein
MAFKVSRLLKDYADSGDLGRVSGAFARVSVREASSACTSVSPRFSA